MRRLHNEDLYALYFSPNIVRVRWAGHVGRVGARRGVYRVLTEEPDGIRPLGRPGDWLLGLEIDS